MSMNQIDNVLLGVVSEVLMAGERGWWLKRAEDFERAKPQPGQFTGRATREQLSAQWRRLDDAANACRARAELCDRLAAERDVVPILEDRLPGFRAGNVGIDTSSPVASPRGEAA